MRIYYFILLLSCISQAASSQVFPLQVNAQLFPPYSPYLSDYTAPGSQKFMVQVRGNDLALTDYRVKLRITIEGVNITIRTKPEFVPQQPIIMQGGGIPQIFYGEDLAEYFDPNALDFAGITRSQYQKGAKLPEGLYRFTIEVQDYNRHTVVSNKSTTMAWVILNDPPILNLPRNDSKMRIFDPSNIVFSWTPRHTGSPNAAFTTEYIFRLVEIWPLNRNPYDAFLTQPALYEVIIPQTQIVYGLAEPALIPGRKYAWQVQAKDMEGRDLFKNQGKSEVFVFQFGDALGVPENFSQQAANSSTLSLRWDPATSGEMPDQYRIRYKPVDGETWYETVTQQRWSTLSRLPADTEYEVQIRAEKGKQFSEYSPTLRTNTTATDPNEFSCGIEGKMATPGEAVASIMLTPGEVFYSRNFEFVITSVTNLGGSFDGEALMPVPWFNGASVKVRFAGVKLDANYELVAGAYQSVYNPGSELTQVVDEMHSIGEQKAQEAATQTQTDSVSNIQTISYLVPGIIDSVYVNEDGQIEVIDQEGNKTIYEQKKDEGPGKTQGTVVADSQGNAYTIEKDGNVQGIDGGAGNRILPDVYSPADSLRNNEQLKKLFIEALDEFKNDINVWLLNNGKGPLDRRVMRQMQEFPDCLPKNVNKLEEALKIIEEFKNNPEALLDSVLRDAANKEFLEEQLTNINGPEPYQQYFTREAWQTFREMICIYLKRLEEERINFEGFAATVQGDTVITDEIYVVNTENIELKLAYYSKTEDEGEIGFKVSVKEEGADMEVLYPAKEWNEGERNKPWTLILEPIKEGKYTITYKVADKKESYEFWVRHRDYDFACKVCGRDLEVTLDDLGQIFTGKAALTEDHVTHFNAALKTGKFHTCHRQAHFFAQVKVETREFETLSESGYYQLHSALVTYAGIASTKDWYQQSFFDDKVYLDYFHHRVYEKMADNTFDYKGNSYQTYKWKSTSISDTVRVPTQYTKEKGDFKKLSFTSDQIKLKSRKFFSAVYANKYGNGAPSTEDGYKYRGQGAIQLTWKDNYRAVSKKCNQLFGTSYDWETNPAEVSDDLKAAIYSSVAYFHFRLRGDLKLLDGTDLNTVSRAVNGGTNGIDHRRKAFDTLIKLSLFNNCKPQSPKE